MSDIKVVGTVSIINRLAQSIGFGANSKVAKPCKSIVQVRNRSDGRRKLVVSTRKDVVAQEYEVRRIEKLRMRHLDEGIATIDISEPPMSVLLKGCDPAELKRFMTGLQSFCKTTVRNGESADSEAPSKVEVNTKAEPKNEEEVKSGSVRRSTGSLKRPRSPELSKTFHEKTKKALSSANFKIAVRKRENYPKEFSPSVQHILIQGVGLKKFDYRMLKLKCLTILDLTDNQLKSVYELVKLNCRLKSLILTNNQIQSLRDDFFLHPALSGLEILNLSKNYLEMLPSSINNLHGLSTAKLNDNKIVVLPYNIQDMCSLRSLDLSNNLLAFIPKTVTLLHLTFFDISGNPTVTEKNRSRGDITELYTFPAIPTLFEAACEVLMNVKHVDKLITLSSSLDVPLFPAIVGTYLTAGKYCMMCGKMSLRFKLTTVAASTRSLCTGMMSRCMISPVSECNVKSILCYDCDKKIKRNNAGRRIMVNF